MNSKISSQDKWLYFAKYSKDYIFIHPISKGLGTGVGSEYTLKVIYKFTQNENHQNNQPN